MPRRLLARAAVLAFLAGGLFLIGLIASQPAHAAVTDTPGTTAGPAGAVAGATGATAGAVGTTTGTVSQAATAASQAASQPAGQAAGLATSATQSTGTTATGAASSSLGSSAAAAGTAAGQAAGAATTAVSGVVTTTSGVLPGGTASGGGTQPPHKHRRGHPRHHHGTPGGRPGRYGRPAPGLLDRPAAGSVTPQHLLSPRTASSITTMGARHGGPASPSPVLPAFPAPPLTGPASGSGIEGHAAGHAPAGLPARTALDAGRTARVPAMRSADWTALIRDRRGPHRPG